jgi:hypothetical protein
MRGVAPDVADPPLAGIDVAVDLRALGMPAPRLELEPLGHMGPI